MLRRFYPAASPHHSRTHQHAFVTPPWEKRLRGTLHFRTTTFWSKYTNFEISVSLTSAPTLAQSTVRLAVEPYTIAGNVRLKMAAVTAALAVTARVA